MIKGQNCPALIMNALPFFAAIRLMSSDIDGDPSQVVM